MTDGTDAKSISIDVDLGARYDLGPLLGKGGMGEVRLARDVRIDREVAVKLMHYEGRDDRSIARFFREARVQGALEHPSVVPVHDLGIDREGHPYFVMKRLAGITLLDVFREPSEKWPRRTLLARFVDVCLAIEFAHQRGVVHRDIKPANIMLGDFGEAYVLDWGLARIVGDTQEFDRIDAPPAGAVRDMREVRDSSPTVAGDLLGTPGYMSPEQARGEIVDARTDVFALGCVLYQMLAGHAAMPHGFAALELTLEAKEHRPSSEIPELDELCALATSSDPALRPSARVIAERIQAYLDGDRDRDRRRALADRYAKRASETLAGTTTDDARAHAMRDAGRALALEPDCVLAQQIIGRMLFAAPATMPVEALAAADEERGRIRQRLIRFAAGGFLAMLIISFVLFFFDVHRAWPLVGLVVSLMGCTIGTYVSSINVESMRPPLYPVVLGCMWAALLMLGLIFGPLFLLPIFVTGSLAAWLMMPVAYRSWLLVAVHGLTIVPLVVLELAGVLPSTFHVEGGRLVLESWVVELTPSNVAITWVVALVVQTASSMNVMLAFRRALQESQDARHAQSWHLAQLLPRSRDHAER